ncbi:MAG: hypothetical protein M0D55_02505 [Elusimicrobiota bacterium]|nr:MAG: hypothetical protein M0D55_02505 [Elusimicrobiota bacterium]
MKTMNRRPKTTLARVLLAAFLVTLPGSREAFAQVAGRIAPVSGVGTPGAVGSSLGGSLGAPGLSAPLSPASLTASALMAPSAAIPAAIIAPAALTPAAAIPAAIKAAAVPAASKGEPVTAKAVLGAAALKTGALAPDSAAGVSKAAASAAFDGSNGKGDVPAALTPSRGAASTGDGSSSGGGNGGALVPARPAAAPVIALNKVFFPGVNSVRFSFSGEETHRLVKLAMLNGGWMIATSAGADEKGHSPAAVLAKLSQLDETNPAKMSVLMTVVDTVKIAAYGEKDGVPVAKVTYPRQGSDAKRLENLGALAQHTSTSWPTSTRSSTRTPSSTRSRRRAPSVWPTCSRRSSRSPTPSSSACSPSPRPRP